MKYIKIVCAMSILLSSSSSLLSQADNLSRARDILLNANIIAVKRVGYDDKMSDKCWALNYILRSSETPTKELEQIYENTKEPCGKIYCIVGLLEANNVIDKKLAKKISSLRAQNVKVRFIQVDLVDWVDAQFIVESSKVAYRRKSWFIIDEKTSLDGVEVATTNAKNYER